VVTVARRVLIVGGGRVGLALARLLTEAANDVIVVEARSEQAATLAATVPAARGVCGDGTDPAVLEAAGIRAADVVAAVTGDDAANLVVTALARHEFGVPRTIGRIVDPAHAWLFDATTGVDVAVDQAALLAGLIAEELSLGDVAVLLKLRRGDLDLMQERIAQRSPAVGRTIGQLALPAGCSLVAVLRGAQVLPAHDEVRLQAGDEVLALAHTGAVGALAALLGPAG
jgi:trk system potassium uptake protein